MHNYQGRKKTRGVSNSCTYDLKSLLHTQNYLFLLSTFYYFIKTTNIFLPKYLYSVHPILGTRSPRKRKKFRTP